MKEAYQKVWDSMLYSGPLLRTEMWRPGTAICIPMKAGFTGFWDTAPILLRSGA